LAQHVQHASEHFAHASAVFGLRPKTNLGGDTQRSQFPFGAMIMGGRCWVVGPGIKRVWLSRTMFCICCTPGGEAALSCQSIIRALRARARARTAPHYSRAFLDGSAFAWIVAVQGWDRRR
jgi:hypothetical protein